MKKINWTAAAVMVTLITALVIAAMSIQDLKTGFNDHCVTDKEWKIDFIIVIKDLTREVKGLKKEIVDTRHEYELNKIRNDQ